MRALVLTIILLLPAASGRADPMVDRLFDAISLRSLVEIHHSDALRYGMEMADGRISDEKRPAWRSELERIYDHDRMLTILGAHFTGQLSDRHANAVIDFYQTELGQKAIETHDAAARALADPDLEQASKDALARLVKDGAPRLEQIRAFVDVTDIVEKNVAAELNYSFAYLSTLQSAGGMGERMSEAELLDFLWSDVEAIRLDTAQWAFSFLNLAFSGLTNDELDRLIAFEGTEAGQAMGTAMFAAWDHLYLTFARDLATAEAAFFGGQDL